VVWTAEKYPGPPLKAVAETASSLGFSYFLAGATARDLILENVFGRPPGRLTRDLDFGFALGLETVRDSQESIDRHGTI
jgi:predicted nucleotidyltransferase